MKLSKLLILPFIATLSGCGSGSGDDEDTSFTNVDKTPAVTIKVSVEANKVLNEPTSGNTISPVNVSLTANAVEEVTVSFTVESDNSTPDEDYNLNSGSIKIPVGSRTGSIELELLNDDIDENDEQITITLTDVTGAELNQSSKIANVTIKDKDPDAEIQFVHRVLRQGSESSNGVVGLELEMDKRSERNVAIHFTTSGTAIKDADYRLLTQSPLTLDESSENYDAENNTYRIFYEILADDIPEGGESLIFELTDVANSQLGEILQSTVIIPGELGLNDTGIVTYFDGNGYTAETSSIAGQDAEFGRDAQNPQDFDGHAGFSFTKIDIAGNALPSNSNEFSCSYDEQTGLYWEVKQETHELFPVELTEVEYATLVQRAKLRVDHTNYQPFLYTAQLRAWQSNNYQYYWYNLDAESNGGHAGAQGDRFKHIDYPAYHYGVCAFPDENASNHSRNNTACSTKVYTEFANSLAICGFKDWRLPTIEELRSIQSYHAQAASLSPNTINYFPNTLTNSEYVTSSPSADGTGAVWCLNSTTGQAKLCHKQIPSSLRLVRGGKQ